MKENYEENELKFKYVKTRHENCHDSRLAMSQYFHSLGDFSIGVGETTLEMRKA